MATELAHPPTQPPLQLAPGSLFNSAPGRWAAILTVLLLFAQTLPAVKFFAFPAHYLPLHIVLEFVAITITGMVAGLAWNLRERRPNNHRTLLGAGFLAVCWIDIAHTLSYAGMPALITPSGPEKAINFWLAGRLVAAATLFAIAVLPPRQWSAAGCRLAIAGALGLIGLVGGLGFFHADALPRTFIAGQGLTDFKIGAEYFLTAAYATCALLLYRKARRSRNADWLWLAAAAWSQGLAELYFTLYADVTDLFNLLGHVYKAIAYVMVYRALFVAGVLAPYRELDAERSRLRESENELAQHRDRLEQLVSERTRQLSEQNRRLEATLARLRQTQNELVQAQKLSSLGKLVAGVAHELNTPIGNARTVASALGGQSTDFSDKPDAPAGLRKSELQDFLAQVEAGTRLLENNLSRAANLIQSFKQVAVDRSSSQRREFDLRAVSEEVIATLHPTLEATPFAVELAIAPGIRVEGYPGPYGQVIFNLIENALIHGLYDRPQGRITVSGRQCGEFAEIEVSDDGWGIASENLAQVFDPFFTTRLGQGGSGLGLNIVFNIVSGLLGGKISVDNAPGGGARFRITIPLAAPEHAQNHNEIMA